MKKFVFVYVIVMCVYSLNAQNYVEFTPSENIAPSTTIIQSNDTIVEFGVIIPGMYETPIDTILGIVSDYAERSFNLQINLSKSF